MKRLGWRLAAVGLVVGAICYWGMRPARAADDAKVPAGFKTVDLRGMVTMDWADDHVRNARGGWTRQGGNDMREVKPGIQTLLGVPFDLIDASQNDGKAVLTLHSKKFNTGVMSASVAVGAKAASIYFLHASAWTGGHMATYTVTYDDNSTVAIPIRAGEEINEWWNPQHGTHCRAALHVGNAECDDVGLLMYGWDNPNPDKVIKSLEFKSENGNGIVMVTAVTLSDKPAVLPDPKDIPTPDSLKSDVDTLDPTQWFVVEPKQDKFQPTCIDQIGHLDGPAGKHGFQKTVNGKWVFDDGTPCRMVATMGNAPATKEQAAFLARWLAKYGFTMVRVGHLVTGPGDESAVDWKKPDTQQLNSAYMDRLDYFINELAKNGIYTRVSSIWYRKMKKGDNIDGFDEAVAYAHKREKTPPPAGQEEYLDTVGITFFHPRVMQLNIDLEKALVTHKNPYRNNVAYGQDPAICQFEVTNEDGVFFYTFDGIAPVYTQMLNKQWIDWLTKKYGGDTQLAAAWGDELGGNESLASGKIGRQSLTAFGGNAAAAKPKRVHDQMEFYVSLQNQYFIKTRDALREAGMKQPICGSGWFGAGNTFFADLYANAKGMDYIDRHHYWGGGPGGWQILALPFDPTCALTKPQEMLKLGGERVIGMPFTISEWANTLPNQYRLEAPALMAFYGNRLGGWDAPVHFALEFPGFGGASGFTNLLKWMWPVNEASTWCQYPALSQMIRQADIQEGPDAFIRNLSDDKVLGAMPMKDVAINLSISGPYEAMASKQGINARSLAATYAAAVGRTGIAFTGKEEKPDFSIDLNKYIDMDKKEIRSATGELYWNYGTGYVTANAPRMQGVVGFFTNIPIQLKDCQIRTSNLVASVLISPLDEKPLSESQHILITAVGRCRNTGMAYSRGGRRLMNIGQSPTCLEGVKGAVTLSRTGNCTVTALDPWGYKTVAVTLPKTEGGQIVIPLDGQNKAAYYEVEFAAH